MKKILFASLFLLTQITLWAQTEKGRWTAGVSIGSITYQTAEAGHSFAASLNPSLGRFVATNLLVGTGVPFSLSSSKYANSSIGYSTNNVLAPY